MIDQAELQPGKRVRVVKSRHPADGQIVTIVERIGGDCAFQYIDGAGSTIRAVLSIAFFDDKDAGKMVRRLRR